MIYAETDFCLFQINCGQLLYETEQFFERLNQTVYYSPRPKFNPCKSFSGKFKHAIIQWSVIEWNICLADIRLFQVGKRYHLWGMEISVLRE